MAMKDTAIFLNSGRGDAVASEVLYEALSEGWIASAGIDVTETGTAADRQPIVAAAEPDDDTAYIRTVPSAGDI